MDTFWQTAVRIDSPLKYWAFGLGVLLVLGGAALTSKNFVRIIEVLTGHSLPDDYRFRLCKLMLIFGFVSVILAILLHFLAPLANKSLEVQSQRLSDKTRIAEAENNEFRVKYEQAWHMFEGGDYDIAFSRFSDLAHVARSDTTRESMIGLQIACYDGQGRYEDGLNFICQQYESMPRNVVKFRFDIA